MCVSLQAKQGKCACLGMQMSACIYSGDPGSVVCPVHRSRLTLSVQLCHSRLLASADSLTRPELVVLGVAAAVLPCAACPDAVSGNAACRDLLEEASLTVRSQHSQGLALKRLCRTCRCCCLLTRLRAMEVA